MIFIPSISISSTEYYKKVKCELESPTFIDIALIKLLIVVADEMPLYNAWRVYHV